jgi:hypothetical protein
MKCRKKASWCEEIYLFKPGFNPYKLMPHAKRYWRRWQRREKKKDVAVAEDVS